MIKKLLPIASLLLVFCAVTFAIHFGSDKLFLFFEEKGWYRESVDLSPVTDGEKAERFQEWTVSRLNATGRFSRDQSLFLINTEHLLNEGHEIYPVEYKDTDVYMNECAVDAFAALSGAVRERFGKKLYVSSDFRTSSEQELLYLEDPDTATAPGASEHQAGLALDVYVAGYAGEAFIKTQAGRFVNRECWKYGFIIRYPFYGEKITGIRYEPWHIRYVGAPHAEIIYGNGLTLEEYIESLEIDVWYETEEYYICRTLLPAEGGFLFPAEFESCVFSVDNTGYGILTVKK